MIVNRMGYKFWFGCLGGLDLYILLIILWRGGYSGHAHFFFFFFFFFFYFFLALSASFISSA